MTDKRYTECDEVGENLLKGLTPQEISAAADQWDNARKIVYAQFPDEGMQWRDNVADALYAAAKAACNTR